MSRYGVDPFLEERADEEHCGLQDDPWDLTGFVEPDPEPEPFTAPPRPEVTDEGCRQIVRRFSHGSRWGACPGRIDVEGRCSSCRQEAKK